MNPSVPGIMVEQPVSRSQLARILNAFIAPRKTFGGLHSNASWWIAWLLLALVSYGFAYAVDRKIGIERISQRNIAKSASIAAKFERMDAKQRAFALRKAVKFTRGMTYAFPVLTLIGPLIVAGILMATFNYGPAVFRGNWYIYDMPTPGTASETVVFGVRRRLTSAERRIRKVKFRVASAIVMYGFMPLAITPLAGIVRLVHGINPQGFEPSNPLPSNPAYFMDPAGHKFLYGLAGGLDIFALWTVVLLGIGFACQSRMKRSTAIMIVLGWYVMLRLMVAGLAALFLL